MIDGKFVFGPGKADLLAAIHETGSLAAAARTLGMSYMRAWKLAKEIQLLFNTPVLELHRGGRAQGARLTPEGEKALALYKLMESEAIAATEKSWTKFNAMVRRA
jgi:molybdate transport system regulatory protein